jgi:hypothetical protein
MISTKFLSVRAYIEAKTSDAAARRTLATYAAALAVSRQLLLPSAPSEHGGAVHYDGTLFYTAQHELCQIHEDNLPLDLDQAFEACRMFWLVRYCAAHPEVHIPLVKTKGAGFLAQALNAARFLNAEAMAFCERYDELVLTTANRISQALATTAPTGSGVQVPA